MLAHNASAEWGRLASCLMRKNANHNGRMAHLQMAISMRDATSPAEAT